jgi:RHS repeat-associated protein
MTKLFNCVILAAVLFVTQARAQTVEYIHTDALGTPVAVTDANRNVIERSEYTPYGDLLNRADADGPGYAGHVQDAATGLSYMQQRFYDPGIGRFLSRDPVTANPNTGANFNAYWYANNSPYSFKDPDGRESANVTLGLPWNNSGGTLEQKSAAMIGMAGMLVGLGAGGVGVAAIASDVSQYGAVNAVMLNIVPVLDVGIAAAEGVAGVSLGASVGASGAVGAKQAANLARFEKSMPIGSTGTAVDSLGEGVVFTAVVPGKVPGSQAVYQKTVDAAGTTSSLLKTTSTPAGEVVHIKDKINNVELPKY